MNERRRLPRTVIWKPAEIELPDTASVTDCIVVDINSAGAQLLLPAGLLAADEFRFSFDHFRSVRKCRVAWQNNRSLGAEFYT